MRRLPLFVLPTVLYPGGRCNLHVFEPRYRQMVARCLEFDRRFGLLFHRRDLYGVFRPEDGGIGCVAEIHDFRPLPDGRSVFEAHGLKRFRIVDGLESRSLYHEALVEDYEDEGVDASELRLRRRRSADLFRSVLRWLSVPEAAVPSIDLAEDTSFQLAERIENDSTWHQEVLELRREIERLDLIDQVLLAVRQTEDGAEGLGEPPPV